MKSPSKLFQFVSNYNDIEAGWNLQGINFEQYIAEN
jgi:hypothetical protein